MQYNKQIILSFKLNGQRFGLYLQNAEKVIRAIAVTPVPKAAPSIFGIIDLYGEHIPVVNIRERFSMPPKDINASDRFIISVWKKRKMAIAVDEVGHPVDISGKETNRVDVSAAYPKGQIRVSSGLEVIDAVSDEGGVILIYDLETLLGNETIMAVEEIISMVDNKNGNG